MPQFQVHPKQNTINNILEFFEEPRCISLTDAAKAIGYGRGTMERYLPWLVKAGYLKRTTYPHIWGKPYKYEKITPRAENLLD